MKKYKRSMTESNLVHSQNKTLHKPLENIGFMEYNVQRFVIKGR